MPSLRLSLIHIFQYLSGIVEYGAVGCGGYDSNQVFVFVFQMCIRDSA